MSGTDCDDSLWLQPLAWNTHFSKLHCEHEVSSGHLTIDYFTDIMDYQNKVNYLTAGWASFVTDVADLFIHSGSVVDFSDMKFFFFFFMQCFYAAVFARMTLQRYSWFMNVNKIKKASTSTRVNTFFMVSSVSFKSSSKENYDDFLLYFTVPFKATLTPKVFFEASETNRWGQGGYVLLIYAVCGCGTIRLIDGAEQSSGTSGLH